jgi:hypothetical protein
LIGFPQLDPSGLRIQIQVPFLYLHPPRYSMGAILTYIMGRPGKKSRSNVAPQHYPGSEVGLLSLT